MGVAQQLDEWTPKSEGRTALAKKNSETKKKGQICPAPKKLRHGQTKRANMPGGIKRDFPY